MTSYADQNEASPSLGAANSENVATFVCFWLAQRRDVLRGSEGGLGVPGCELSSCHHVCGLLGGPAEWCHTQFRMTPRRP